MSEVSSIRPLPPIALEILKHLKQRPWYCYQLAEMIGQSTWWTWKALVRLEELGKVERFITTKQHITAWRAVEPVVKGMGNSGL